VSPGAGADGAAGPGPATGPVALPLTAAVLASGSGSNFQALVDAEGRGAPWRVRLLLSDREDAGAIARAGAAGVVARVIPVKGVEPGVVERDTLEALEAAGAQVVFLAGYLRLVPAGVVSAFRRRILNVHPALLPAFGGKGMYGRKVHEAVLAAGCRLTGVTVHYVDERYDEGTIVAQWPVPVLAGDNPEALAARVLAVEHRLYPLVADHVCRALAAGTEPGPLPAGGTAFAASGAAHVSTIDTLYRERFPEP